MASEEHGPQGSTHLSLIQRAKAGGRYDLELLFRRYEETLRTFLVRKGATAIETDELLQGFFVKKVLEGKLLDQFDSSRGRFRTYLCSSLNNYRFDHYRRIKIQPVSLDSHDPPDISRDADLFDVVYVRSIVSQALRDVRAECERRNQLRHWDVFEERYIKPMMNDDQPTPFAELAAKYGFASETQVSNHVETIRRKFKRIFESHVKSMVPVEEQDTELGHLLDSLAKARRDPSPAIERYEASRTGTAEDSLGIVNVQGLQKFVEQLENRELRSWESFSAELDDVMKTPFDVLQESGEFSSPLPDSHSPTVRELLLATDSTLEQLSQAKRVFKWLGRSPLSVVSPQMAQFAYFCAIFAALAIHNSRITALSDDDLRNGIEWIRSLSLPDEWDDFLNRVEAAVRTLSPDVFDS